MNKPVLLYYIHHHGTGHAAVFAQLAPHITKYFHVIACGAKPALFKEVADAHSIEVCTIPSKWPAHPLDFTHTFSKAFEGIPYAAEPAVRSRWLADLIITRQPAAAFIDGSAELAIMARSMGLPVTFIRLMGEMSQDPTQVFAYEAAQHIVAMFPASLEVPNYPHTAKTSYMGYVAKYAPALSKNNNDTTHVTILLGSDNIQPAVVRRITADPTKTFHIIGNKQVYDVGKNCRQYGRVADVAAAIKGDIVVSAAGQNTVAELLALGKKLVLLPEPRPYQEQQVTARQLAAQGYALCADTTFDAAAWHAVIRQAATLNGREGQKLVNPQAAAHIAALLREWYATV